MKPCFTRSLSVGHSSLISFDFIWFLSFWPALQIPSVISVVTCWIRSVLKPLLVNLRLLFKPWCPTRQRQDDKTNHGLCISLVLRLCKFEGKWKGGVAKHHLTVAQSRCFPVLTEFILQTDTYRYYICSIIFATSCPWKVNCTDCIDCIKHSKFQLTLSLELLLLCLAAKLSAVKLHKGEFVPPPSYTMCERNSWPIMPLGYFST